MLRRALWATATTKSSPGTVIDLYKAEMTHSKRVWESTAAVELVTMGGVLVEHNPVVQGPGLSRSCGGRRDLPSGAGRSARCVITSERNPGRFSKIPAHLLRACFSSRSGEYGCRCRVMDRPSDGRITFCGVLILTILCVLQLLPHIVLS